MPSVSRVWYCSKDGKWRRACRDSEASISIKCEVGRANLTSFHIKCSKCCFQLKIELLTNWIVLWFSNGVWNVSGFRINACNHPQLNVTLPRIRAWDETSEQVIALKSFRTFYDRYKVTVRETPSAPVWNQNSLVVTFNLGLNLGQWTTGSFDAFRTVAERKLATVMSTDVHVHGNDSFWRAN